MVLAFLTICIKFGKIIEKSLCKMSIDKMAEIWYNRRLRAAPGVSSPSKCTKVFNNFVYVAQKANYTKTPTFFVKVGVFVFYLEVKTA